MSEASANNNQASEENTNTAAQGTRGTQSTPGTSGADAATRSAPGSNGGSNGGHAAQRSSKDNDKTGLQGYLKALQGNTLLPLLLAGAASIALIVALFMWASAPDYRVLFNNLSEADGGTILAELESRGVPYQLSSNGQAILVQSDQVHRLRLQLAEQGLPQAGNVGFELMDNQSFGISQFAEQVNFQRSLEGELARSMRSMNPVADARVHISMPRDSVFVRDREPAKASVVLTLHPGRSLGQPQVNAIMHLVSSSVPDLSTDKVTVVSHSGELLSGSQNDNGIDGDRLSYAEEVERRYQQRIENILAPLYGRNNIRVQVTAAIDFSSREETRETYRPNQDPNEAAIRSTQTSGALRGTLPEGVGVPGALSNSPPGWTPAQIEVPPEEEDEDAEQLVQRDYQYDNVVNYEVDRNILHIQHEQGQLQSLAVAAVINYREDLDEAGNPVSLPYSEEDITQADNLIRRAMGFNAARGDQLEVVNSPFSVAYDTDSSLETLWWQEPQIQSLALSTLKYLLVALMALFVWKRLVRPLLNRHLESGPAMVAAGVGAVGTEQAAQSAAPAPGAHIDTAVGDTPSQRQRQASNYENDLKEVRSLAHDDPRLIAMVVRSWMNKDED